MSYERNDRRSGTSDNRPSYGGASSDRGRYGYGRPDHGRDNDDNRAGPQRDPAHGRPETGRAEWRDRGQDDDRGFFDRAGDEVRSWFGDEEAERRRRHDEFQAEREDRPGYGAGQRSGASSYGDAGYDRGRGAPGASPSYGPGQRDERSAGHDQSYRSWRDRQMQDFDRDYEEYRREHQSKFDNEFHSWRTTRQSQRDLLGKVQEHQEVVGSDGQHIGTVDHVRGDRIKLTKTDQDARGHHHSIPSSWIQSVDDKITISKTAEQAKAHWRDEDRNDGGLFGGRDEDRGTNLNRSFSGTY